jgi:hypothetical protein
MPRHHARDEWVPLSPQGRRRVSGHTLRPSLYIAAPWLVSFAQDLQFTRKLQLQRLRKSSAATSKEEAGQLVAGESLICALRERCEGIERGYITNGVSSAGPAHRRQRVEAAPRQERRPAGGGGGGEAAAKEAEVHVEEEEEKRGAAEAGRGEVVRVRPAELLPELRRRPCILRRPPPLVSWSDPSAARVLLCK